MSTPTPDPGSGWWFVAVALAVPAGLEIVKRVLDYLLPPGRHVRGVERYSRSNEDADAEDDCRGDTCPDPAD